jgi:serine/threonine-protein kinase
MQSLMRAELERPEKGVLSAIFNNTYVLIALLALLIAGGFWWFRPRQATPDEVFARSEAILEQEPGPEWLGVRKELQALRDDDPMTWSERVDPLLKKIELYELRRSVRGTRGLKDAAPRNEGERLLQLGLHYRQIGDLARAERALAALHALLSGDERRAKLDELTVRLLEDVRRQLAGAADRDELLNGSLERAAARDSEGKVAEAREIWKGILELYGDDPAAAEFVKQAKEGLQANRNAQ